MKQIYIYLLCIGLCSCGSYNKVHNLSSETTFKDGYWGNWNATYYPYSYSYKYNVKTLYNSEMLNIVIYDENSHPSEFNFNIVLHKKTKTVKDDKWYTYQGVINIGKNNSIQPYFLGDLGKEYRCEIRCDKKMQKSINKNGLKGTINVYYNNIGRAFSFN